MLISAKTTRLPSTKVPKNIEGDSIKEVFKDTIIVDLGLSKDTKLVN